MYQVKTTSRGIASKACAVTVGEEELSNAGTSSLQRSPKRLSRSIVLMMLCVVVLSLAGTAPKLWGWVREKDSRRAMLQRMKGLVLRTGVRQPVLGNTIQILRGRSGDNESLKGKTVATAPWTSSKLIDGFNSSSSASACLEQKMSSHALPCNATADIAGFRAGNDSFLHDSLGRPRRTPRKGHLRGTPTIAQQAPVTAKQALVVHVDQAHHNPTIDRCNLPDTKVVPRAHPHAKVSVEESSWWDTCNFWDKSRTKGTFRAVFRGRMANGLLQYFWMRVRADSNDWGLMPQNAARHDGSNWSSPVMNYQHATFGHVEGAPTAKVFQQGCGPHFQQYIFYRDLRCLAQCIFKPKDRHEMNSTAFLSLGPNDVVIHYREPYELINPLMNKEHYSKNRTTPDFVYYARILDRLKKESVLGSIWIVAEWHYDDSWPDSMRAPNVALKQVVEKYNATFVKGRYTHDHYLARQAPVFIGSFGTFSWTVAFLSVAKEIHLPFDPDEKVGSTWNRWNLLFIHDDKRIRYHDAFAPDKPELTFLTAQQVMNATHRFAQGIRRRTQVAGHCDPRMQQAVEGDAELWRKVGKDRDAAGPPSWVAKMRQEA